MTSKRANGSVDTRDYKNDTEKGLQSSVDTRDYKNDTEKSYTVL